MSKQIGTRRKEYFKQMAIETKLASLTREEKEKLNQFLDDADAINREEEDGEKTYQIAVLGISKFIDECYDKHLAEKIVCNRCANYETCYREKKCKSCNRFIEKEEEESEEEENDSNNQIS